VCDKLNFAFDHRI